MNQIFGSYFGRNDDFINSFWNLLTFRGCQIDMQGPPFAQKLVIFGSYIENMNFKLNVVELATFKKFGKS